MKIDSYSFGRIVINGKTYTSDVIIFPDKVDASWWRKEGHLLQLADGKSAAREAGRACHRHGQCWRHARSQGNLRPDREPGDRGEGGTDVKDG